MQIFETERLELWALSLNNLILLRDNMQAFEEQFQCTYNGEKLEGFIEEYLEDQIRIILENEASCVYHAFWLLLRKEDRVVVGSIAFKGLPNTDGEIEIGYGLNPIYEHNGYMTEAVAKACEWGLQQENVKFIIAETDADGYASMRILERNGFVRYKFEKESWWRLY